MADNGGLRNCNPDSSLTNIEIQRLARTENWPNHHTRKIIKELVTNVPPSQSTNEIIKLPLKDITPSKLGLELAKKYEPKITLIGQVLKAERNSDAWGGMYFRVLSDKEEGEEPTNIVIQYIYTWVQQKLPFTFWNWIIPLIALTFFSVYFNSPTFIFESHVTDILDPMGFTFRVNLEDAAALQPWISGFVMVVGFVLFVWLGLVPLLRFGYGHFVSHTNPPLKQRGMIVLGLGLIVVLCLVSEFLCPITELSVPATFSTQHYAMGSEVAIGGVTFRLVIFLGVSAIIIKYQDKVLSSENRFYQLLNRISDCFRKIVGIHAMDYAPIFIYLKKNSSSESQPMGWEIVECQWDHLHYSSEYLSSNSKIFCHYKESQKKGDNHIHFVIKNAWHSFEIVSKRNFFQKIFTPRRRWFVSFGILAIFGIGTILWYFSVFFLDWDFWADFGMLFYDGLQLFLPNQFLIDLSWAIFFDILPAFSIIITMIYTVIRWPTNLETDQDFEKEDLRYYHLNCQKLKVLWNLPGDAEFIIQDKLQDPNAALKQPCRKGSFKNDSKSGVTY
ncbi:MAG: hypothetical protein ACXADY_25325 [Candidatus Hodarchaeales archaeon]|jgi:hypothetical protein